MDLSMSSALTGGLQAPAEGRPRDGSGRVMARGDLAQAVELQVIPRLLRRHRTADAPLRPPQEAVSARWLAGLALNDDDTALRHAVLQLRLRGLSAEALGLDWLAPCARELGRLWDRDECSFTDVTIGVGRLQRVLRQLDPGGASGVGPLDPPAPHVLLVPAPDEQHTFGLALVADQFRRAGWAVSGGADGAWLDPLARVRAERVDLVGVSIGSDARAAAVPALCAALRRASLNRALAVFVGGPLVVLAPERCSAAALGADALVPDARAALAWAHQRLVELPARPLDAAPAGAAVGRDRRAGA